MNSSLPSSVFGNLRLSEIIPGYFTYGTNIVLPGHGGVSISLGANPSDNAHWPSVLRYAKEAHPTLLQNELAIRQQAASRIAGLYRDYHQHEWCAEETELLVGLRLSHMNFFADGTFELWYSGGDPFEGLDIRIELDSAMRISGVALDG